MICGAISRCKCAIVRSNTEHFPELLETIWFGAAAGTRQIERTPTPYLKDPCHGSAADEKNVRGLNIRIELYVITAAAPGIICAAQQVLHLINVTLHLPETLNRNIDKRILSAMWIKVHNDENDVITRRGHLAVKQNCVVVGVVEPQIRVKLQRAVFFSDLV